MTNEDFRGNVARSPSELHSWHAACQTEAVIEPALPVLDTHHHMVDRQGGLVHYPMDHLRQDIAGGHNIIGTVYVEAFESGWRTTGPQALRPVGEVELLVQSTSAPAKTAQGSCEVAAGIVAHADLRLGDGVARILEAEQQASEGRLRGVRHQTASDPVLIKLMPHLAQPHLLADPAFRRGLAQVEKFGLSFDAWVYHTQLAELVAVVDEFPQLRIVVNHIAAPLAVLEFALCRSEVLKAWETSLRALAKRPNVFMKIGGMGMPIFGFGFENGPRPARSSELARAWGPHIDTCLRIFGTKRCMFESNFPMDKQACGYTELWNAFKLATSTLTETERSDLFYRTGCRVYGLSHLEQRADAISRK